MRFIPRISSFGWLLVMLAALTYLGWTNHRRIERAQYVSGVAQWSVDPPQIERESATGYARARRQFIVPERNYESHEWIAQTQNMWVAGEWRVRRVDYDNAPFGRESHLPGIYRAWLAFIASCDRALSGAPMGLAVERAAQWADPVLHALLVLSGTLVVVWNFGRAAAVVFALAVATVFPFASGFLPGAPDRHVLAQFCAVWSLLAVAIAWRAVERSGGVARVWLVVAGVFGGIGLWVDFDFQWPLLMGIAMGGLAGTAIARRNGGERLPSVPWQWWGLAGCATSLAGTMVEYFPGDLGWRLEGNHPVYAVAWLLLAFAMAAATENASGGAGPTKRVMAVAIAVAVIVILPVAVVATGARDLLPDDPVAARLTAVNGGIAAKHSGEWLRRDGATLAAIATLLPVVVALGGIGFALKRRGGDASQRINIFVMAAAIAMALIGAAVLLRWWSLVDVVVIVALVVLVSRTAGRDATAARLAVWSVGVLAFSILGVAAQWPAGKGAAGQYVLTAAEARSLIERDLAHWLTVRAADGPAPIVLAPPELSTAVAYYGDVRAVSSLHPGNHDGTAAAIRMARASSELEAQELISRREITHIVLPSWDTFLQEVAAGAGENSFGLALHRWQLPPWLQPVAYTLPQTAGFENLVVTVLRVVDPQSEPVAASRLAEYFLEMGQLDRATSLLPRLERYRTNLSARIATAQIESGRGNAGAAEQALKQIQAVLTSGADRSLPWDRRVSLAILFAQRGNMDAAREQAQRCAASATEGRLALLSTGMLYRFRMLQKVAGVEFDHTTLVRAADALLPTDLRERVRAR